MVSTLVGLVVFVGGLVVGAYVGIRLAVWSVVTRAMDAGISGADIRAFMDMIRGRGRNDGYEWRYIMTDELEGGERCCKKPPVGWYCTRAAGHEGPCAALQAPASLWR